MPAFSDLTQPEEYECIQTYDRKILKMKKHKRQKRKKAMLTKLKWSGKLWGLYLSNYLMEEATSALLHQKLPEVKVHKPDSAAEKPAATNIG